jgi:hypothetical protein
MIRLLLCALLAGSAAAAPKPAKKAKKEARPSKYRFPNADPSVSTYRFDSEGKPVERGAKKKLEKKRPMSEEDEIDGIVPPVECGERREACSPKNG